MNKFLKVVGIGTVLVVVLTLVFGLWLYFMFCGGHHNPVC